MYMKEESYYTTNTKGMRTDQHTTWHTKNVQYSMAIFIRILSSVSQNFTLAMLLANSVFQIIIPSPGLLSTWLQSLSGSGCSQWPQSSKYDFGMGSKSQITGCIICWLPRHVGREADLMCGLGINPESSYVVIAGGGLTSWAWTSAPLNEKKNSK